MSAEERARAALADPDVGDDAALEYLRLILKRAPEDFDAVVTRIETQLAPDSEARARMRARLLVLAAES